jgi:hypothetical protein
MIHRTILGIDQEQFLQWTVDNNHLIDYDEKIVRRVIANSWYYDDEKVVLNVIRERLIPLYKTIIKS